MLRERRRNGSPHILGSFCNLSIRWVGLLRGKHLLVVQQLSLINAHGPESGTTLPRVTLLPFRPSDVTWVPFAGLKIPRIIALVTNSDAQTGPVRGASNKAATGTKSRGKMKTGTLSRIAVVVLAMTFAVSAAS